MKTYLYWGIGAVVLIFSVVYLTSTDPKAPIDNYASPIEDSSNEVLDKTLAKTEENESENLTTDTEQLLSDDELLKLPTLSSDCMAGSYCDELVKETFLSNGDVEFRIYRRTLTDGRIKIVRQRINFIDGYENGFNSRSTYNRAIQHPYYGYEFEQLKSLAESGDVQGAAMYSYKLALTRSDENSFEFKEGIKWAKQAAKMGNIASLQDAMYAYLRKNPSKAYAYLLAIKKVGPKGYTTVLEDAYLSDLTAEQKQQAEEEAAL
ncbi:MAG: hypothetical protein OQK04_05910, partial [Kangiellaceae bacterium]|nr:hypothetical protein [Kangiellaceae bacterium]